MTINKIGALVLSAALLASPTLAADVATTPLAAGKPAGTKDAALIAGIPLYVMGLALVGIVVGVTAGNSAIKTAPTATGTSS